MATANWPDTLPTGFETTGFAYGLKPGSVVTPTDVGLARTRRRSTQRIFLVSGSMILQRDADGTDQVEAFLGFLHDTLKGGSLPFRWVDPVNPPESYRTALYDASDANAEFTVLSNRMDRAMNAMPVVASKAMRLSLSLEMVRD